MIAENGSSSMSSTSIVTGPLQLLTPPTLTFGLDQSLNETVIFPFATGLKVWAELHRASLPPEVGSRRESPKGSEMERWRYKSLH